MLENAFEGLVIYTKYSKEIKEQKEKANEFLCHSLLNKALHTLKVHKMCKENQKSLIRDVEKVRRKVLFITWFNHVHDELPG